MWLGNTIKKKGLKLTNGALLSNPAYRNKDRDPRGFNYMRKYRSRLNLALPANE